MNAVAIPELRASKTIGLSSPAEQAPSGASEGKGTQVATQSRCLKTRQAAGTTRLNGLGERNRLR